MESWPPPKTLAWYVLDASGVSVFHVGILLACCQVLRSNQDGIVKEFKAEHRISVRSGTTMGNYSYFHLAFASVSDMNAVDTRLAQVYARISPDSAVLFWVRFRKCERWLLW